MISLCLYSASAWGLRGTDGSLLLEELTHLCGAARPRLRPRSCCHGGPALTTPTEPSIQDSRLVHSTQASLWRAKEANTEPLARSGRCPAGEPPGRSSSLHRGGGPQEPKGHLGNIRQHQGRLAGAVRAGMGLSCQSYRLPLQLVEKELNGEAQHTPPSTSVCESKAPCLLELHCFSATGTF